MVEFIGRTHILILHLPIGIILLAAIFELCHHLEKVTVSIPLFKLIYLTGAVSAILACITGYILSSSGDYGESMVSNHFWAGIVTAVLASLTFILNFTKALGLRKYATLALTLSIIVTGHLGGSITHGGDFLNPFLMQGQEEKQTLEFNVTKISEAVVYEDIIAPLLDNKCVSCHGPKKVKGRLRMDSPEGLRANGKSGEELLAMNGELLRRISLPISHDEHMPPKKKSQLSDAQEQVLRWWISEGAPLDADVQSIASQQDIISTIEKMITESRIAEDLRKNIPATLPSVQVDKPDDEVIKALQAQKIVVLPAGEESHFLDVDFVNVEFLTEDHVAHLMKISEHIINLRISDTRGLDKLFPGINNMKNLVRLYLDGTDVKGNHLTELSHAKYLEFINVSRTDVDDEDVQALKSLPQLRNIYASDTAVMLDSLESGITIVRGLENLEELESDSLRL